jgi:tRNA pseudouridine65 synthase
MPDPATLPVLYRDEHLVVVDKPSGLLVHRSPIDRHETRFALQLVRDQLGQHVYPVHRLDKPTSGALALALNPAAARVLANAFATGGVRKTYVALVRGWPSESGSIERSLAAIEDPVIAPQSSAPRAAITRYRRLRTYEVDERVDRYPTSRYSLLELRPETGRRHQLRRHLAGVSHPIVGDTTYGKARHNRLFERRFGVRRLLLACTRLEFTTSLHDVPTIVEAPLAAEFAAVVSLLEKGCAVDVSRASP